MSCQQIQGTTESLPSQNRNTVVYSYNCTTKTKCQVDHLPVDKKGIPREMFDLFSISNFKQQFLEFNLRVSWNISDHIVFLGHILHLCKDLSVSVHPICAYQNYGQTDKMFYMTGKKHCSRGYNNNQ